MMVLFDRIGRTYNETRQADRRIVDALVRLLDLRPDRIVADIGAGSGNYSRALAERGFRVKAVEPSATMRQQAAYSSAVEWIEGVAEKISLEDNSVDGVISTLAVHHFSELTTSFREMARITTGPIIILTFDPRAGKRTWISDYFPTIWDDAFEVFPPISDVAARLGEASGRQVHVEPFLIPYDITDSFAAAGWRNPRLYLDAGYRENMSPFRLADQKTVSNGVARLAADLAEGRWERKYGDILKLPAIDAGYRFIRAIPA